MLFGARTESLDKVLKDGQADAPVVGEPPGANAPSPSADAPSPGGNAQGGDAQAGAKAKRKPGHGRIGAQAYRGAPVIELDVPELQSGDRCPQCPTGKVYDSAPRTNAQGGGPAPAGRHGNCRQPTSSTGCDAGCATPPSAPCCPRA